MSFQATHFRPGQRGPTAVAAWRQKIDELAEENGGDRFKAAQTARRRHPELARAARDAVHSR